MQDSPSDGTIGLVATAIRRGKEHEVQALDSRLEVQIMGVRNRMAGTTLLVAWSAAGCCEEDSTCHRLPRRTDNGERHMSY